MSLGILLFIVFVLFTIISLAGFTLSEKEFCFCNLLVGTILGVILTATLFAVALTVRLVTDGPMEKEQRVSAEVSKITIDEEREYVFTFSDEVHRKLYESTDFRCNLTDDPILYSEYRYGDDTISGGCEILG